jgi:uncharacterized protein DUF6894
MTDVYFHYSNARGVLMDRGGTRVDDLVEAHAHADRVVRSLIMTASAEDWRGGVLHVPIMIAMKSLTCRSLQCSASRIRRAQCLRNPHWCRFSAA